MGCLQAGCVYQVRIKAQNASGWSQYSIPTDVKAAPGVPHAPAAPKSVGQSAVAIELAWKAPQHDGGSEITSYRLEMAEGVAVSPVLLQVGCLASCLGRSMCFWAVLSQEVVRGAHNLRQAELHFHPTGYQTSFDSRPPQKCKS